MFKIRSLASGQEFDGRRDRCKIKIGHKPGRVLSALEGNKLLRCLMELNWQAALSWTIAECVDFITVSQHSKPQHHYERNIRSNLLIHYLRTTNDQYFLFYSNISGRKQLHFEIWVQSPSKWPCIYNIF